MATEKEIEDCFEALRKLMQEPAPGGVPQREQLLRAMYMAIFILESFVIDVKRIADAQTSIANDVNFNTQNGWQNK